MAKLKLCVYSVKLDTKLHKQELVLLKLARFKIVKLAIRKTAASAHYPIISRIINVF
jgi:hypothetical protein